MQCQPQLVEGDQIAVENLTRFQPAKAVHRLKERPRVVAGGPIQGVESGPVEVTEAAAISGMLLFLARRTASIGVDAVDAIALGVRGTHAAVHTRGGGGGPRTSPGSRSRLSAAASRRPASRPSWRAMRARTARRHTHRPRRSAFPHTRPHGPRTFRRPIRSAAAPCSTFGRAFAANFELSSGADEIFNADLQCLGGEGGRQTPRCCCHCTITRLNVFHFRKFKIRSVVRETHAKSLWVYCFPNTSK